MDFKPLRIAFRRLVHIGRWGENTDERTIQVRIRRGDHQFVAECLDLPVVTQAATLDELAANIPKAIGLHLAGEDLAVLGFSSNPTILATMELEAVARCRDCQFSRDARY